jgi:hypothetical protein
MSKFGTKGVKAPSNISKYLEPGNFTLKINNITLRTSSTGSKQVLLEMETLPIMDEGFTPEGDAKGRVGRVAASGYLNTKEKQAEFINGVLLKIAIATDSRASLDAIEVDSDAENAFEEYINKAKDVLVGKFAKWCIAGEEYENQTGRIRVRLQLPKYDFVGDVEGTIKVSNYDASNKYHLKRYNPPTSEFATGQATDDLPF